MTDLLFVYGTLMHASKHPMARRLREAAAYLGPAHYQGRLYMISYYPGLVPSDDPADHVHGDLYRVPDDAALMAALDEYENCGPGYPDPAEYVRTTQTITLTRDSSRHDALVYLYNWPLNEASRIASGRFPLEA